MAAELYKQYFGIPEAPLFVGAKRFKVTELFAEDLFKRFNSVGEFQALVKHTHKAKERSQNVARLQITASVRLVREVCAHIRFWLLFINYILRPLYNFLK